MHSLLSIIDVILDLATIDAGALELELEDVSIWDIMGAFDKVMRETLRFQPATIVDRDIPLRQHIGAPAQALVTAGERVLTAVAAQVSMTDTVDLGKVDAASTGAAEAGTLAEKSRP